MRLSLAVIALLGMAASAHALPPGAPGGVETIFEYRGTPPTSRATLVSGRPGALLTVACANTGAQAYRFKVYDAAASAAIATPVRTLCVPGRAGACAVGEMTQWPGAVALTAGLAVTATVGAATTDTGPPPPGTYSCRLVFRGPR